MLGIARQLARHDTPLVGINQGRLGFITDIALGDFETALAPILAGDYDEEERDHARRRASSATARRSSTASR